MSKNKKIPKIKQHQDVKERAVSGVKQLKEYLYDRRGNLTHDEINVMVNQTVEKVAELAYELGWEDRNEIFRVRRSLTHTRAINAFNKFYDDNISKVPVNLMEKFRYIIDVALLNRYFNANVPMDKQISNRIIY